MAKSRKALTKDQLKSLCIAEIDSASGWTSGELAEQRSDALDYYLGEPYGDEVDGRSQVRTREVLDTVESILPSLIRIFTDVENMVEFAPTGPEDEEAADQETQVCNHLYWHKNPGFLNTYTALKDALLSKTGILKVWYDEGESEDREEYRNLNDIELGQLLTDPGEEKEVLDYELGEQGHNITLLVKKNNGGIKIVPCPPEEVGVNRDARSPNIKDCDFVYHRTRKTKAQLVEMGYDEKVVEKLPTHDQAGTEERLARRNLSDEHEGLSWSNHWSMHRVWLTECYVRVDKNGDGIAELLKVTLAAGSTENAAGATLLDVEEVDRIPFVSASPIILTHKYYGLSIADLVMDLQRIKSTLVRSMLDNSYLANNIRTAANERVNLEDLMTSRPGGVVRTEGVDPPGNHLFPIPHNPVPAEAYGLLEYLDDLRKDRTGHSDEVPGLDSKSLANVPVGVAQIAYDQARARIELMARIFAECLFKPLFQDIHELSRKNVDRTLPMKLRNSWVDVRPQAWKERTDLTVMVGMGQTSRERRLMALDQVLSKQAEVVQMGGMGMLVAPQHIHGALIDYTESLGVKGPERYWMDPATAQPPPQQPDPQMMALELTARIEQGKLAMKDKELELRREEMAIEREIEQVKSQLGIVKMSADIKAEGQKAIMTAQKEALELKLKQLQMLLDDQQKADQREVDQYKAELSSLTTLEAKAMDVAQPEQTWWQEGDFAEPEPEPKPEINLEDIMRAIAEVRAYTVDTRAELDNAGRKKKRKIVRDAEGRAVAIDDMPIERDANGFIVGIG